MSASLRLLLRVDESITESAKLGNEVKRCDVLKNGTNGFCLPSTLIVLQ
jgi:hypothetical protein